MSLPGEESAANRFLRAFLADQDTGRARSLVEYQEQFPGFEERIAAEHARLAGGGAAATEGPGPELAPGARVGPYRLVGELGRGGQGAVWRAEDPRIGRTVALKILPAGAVWSVAAVARFRREAELTARLQHAGICPVYDVDLDAGRPYVAMRLVDGETLARRLERARAGGAPLPPEAAALLIEQAARALHAAHTAGVVHRDVKPGNLMLTPEGGVVVLDFGVAREVEGQGLELTRTGDVFGTPAYMAPEQVEGHTADARSDVWALGVTLCEALTLRLPFAGPTREALYRAILTQEPALTRRGPHALPRDLQVLLATALAKEPARRYRSALHLAEDLAAWQAGRPIAARPVSLVGRLWRWARREPRAAALAAGLAVALFGAAGLAGYLSAQRGRLRAGDQALAQRQRAEVFRDVATGLLRGPEAERRLRTVLAENPRITSTRATLAVHLARLGRTGEALAVCDQAPPDHEDPRALDRVRALVLRRAQRVPEAERIEAALGESRGALEGLLASLAAGETAGNDAPRRALEEIQHAVLFLPQHGEVYLERLIVCAAEVEPGSAEVLRAAHVLETLWPESAAAWFHVGLAHAADPERSRAAMRRAITLDVGLAQPYVAEHLFQMQEGDFDGASATFERGLAHTEEGSPERQQLLLVRAQAALACRRFTESLAAADRALAIRPDSVAALLLRAKAQRGLQLPACEATLRRILELDPRHVEARRLLGG